MAERFPLPWTHYVRLMRRTRSAEERAFYETEALWGGWSVRQLERQDAREGKIYRSRLNPSQR
ncbi:DUF1016 N-terminal domain-containing protein [Paraburkholderia sp. RCC_158]|uniref:DUF1016 N-terminal domain-containing protein n=1 Tax=Paraburkholderia sp. RCC_158 TaxID=3239220 RepID=UPI00352454A0